MTHTGAADPQIRVESGLLQSLFLSLSHQKENRIKGNKGLNDYKESSFGLYLANLLEICFQPTSDQFNIGIKQLASVNLKNEIVNSWASPSDPQATLVLDQQTRDFVKAKLIQGLGLEGFVVRRNIALAIAKIAHHEWPEQWPSLFDELIVILQGKDMNAIHGAIRVLSDFVRDDMSDQAFPYLAQLLMPVLYGLFSNPSTLLAIRSGAVKIVAEFVEIIYMVKEEHPEVVSTYLEPIIEIWTPGLLQVISSHDNKQGDLLQIKIQSLRTVVKLVRAFPKHMDKVIPAFLDKIWGGLEAAAQGFQNDFVHISHDDFDDSAETNGCEDEEGDVSGIEAFIYTSLEFVELVAKKKSVRAGVAASLNKMVSVLVGYLQLTVPVEISWSRDVNQFVQDDDDDAVGQNVRIAVDQCFMSLHDAFGSNFVHQVYAAALDSFQLGSESRLSGAETWWKFHEAALFILGRFSLSLIDESRQDPSLPPISRLFETVVAEDLACSAIPLLQGRSLWCAARFSSGLSDSIVETYFKASVNSLNINHTKSLHLCVSSIKSIRELVDTLDGQKILPFQADILRGVCSIIYDGLIKEDSLILALEVITSAVKIDQQTTAQLEGPIGAMLLKVWSENDQDVFIMATLQDLFTILAGYESMSIQFQTQMFPQLISALTPPDASSGQQFNLQMAATSLDLISALVREVADPLPPVYTAQVYPHVIQMLLAVDDTGLLQNGQELLKALVHRDFNGIVSWSNGERSGLEYLLDFIAKMLDPSEAEHCAIFLGPLITKVIQKGGELIVPFIPQLLTAVIQRLGTAKMPAFIQTLVIIFCHFIETKCDVVISFLDSIQVVTGSGSDTRNGLELFLSCWCDVFPDLQGFYQVKLSTTAMMLILSSADARLNSILVKGDLIVQKSQKKIITRSQSRNNPEQYQMIPFPIKAVGLIMDEYVSQVESKMKTSKNVAMAAGLVDQGDSADDEFETDSEGENPYGYYQEDDDDDGSSIDSDYKQNAIYLSDLTVTIKEWVQGLASNRPQDVSEIGNMLQGQRQKTLFQLAQIQ